MTFSQFKTIDGLIPVIAQEEASGEVLMQAYMNEEAYNKTKEYGYMYYYSRSRKTLWKKGETSGHVQKVVDLFIDCDADCILAKVIQTGPACHTNNKTCFYRKIEG